MDPPPDPEPFLPSRAPPPVPHDPPAPTPLTVLGTLTVGTARLASGQWRIDMASASSEWVVVEELDKLHADAQTTLTMVGGEAAHLISPLPASHFECAGARSPRLPSAAPRVDFSVSHRYPYHPSIPTSTAKLTRLCACT